MLAPSLRKIVTRFQRRAQQLGLLEILPKIVQLHANHGSRGQSRRSSPIAQEANKK